MNFDEFLKSISKIENIPLPAQASQFKMVPPFRQDLLKQQKDAIKQAKKAGVLALFYPNKSHETHLVLILRKTYQGVHSAQVGFPGGKLEKHDASIEATAIRETFEEVGVPEKLIEIVRPLTEVYIPPSNFFVYPFLAICKEIPQFIKQDHEVEDIIEVALTEFLNPKSIITQTLKTSYSAEVEVPAFKLNHQVVWGATAMILSEIKDLLKHL